MELTADEGPPELGGSESLVGRFPSVGGNSDVFALGGEEGGGVPPFARTPEHHRDRRVIECGGTTQTGPGVVSHMEDTRSR
jgi:hypothetical protein